MQKRQTLLSHCASAASRPYTASSSGLAVGVACRRRRPRPTPGGPWRRGRALHDRRSRTASVTSVADGSPFGVPRTRWQAAAVPQPDHDGGEDAERAGRSRRRRHTARRSPTPRRPGGASAGSGRGVRPEPRRWRLPAGGWGSADRSPTARPPASRPALAPSNQYEKRQITMRGHAGEGHLSHRGQLRHQESDEHERDGDPDRTEEPQRGDQPADAVGGRREQLGDVDLHGGVGVWPARRRRRSAATASPTRTASEARRLVVPPPWGPRTSERARWPHGA